jgi:hypothetical protein
VFKKIKDKFTKAAIGSPVREWGLIFEQDRSLMNEKWDLSLYKKNELLVLLIKITFKNRISYNVRYYAIPMYDLRYFVSILGSRYNELCRMADSQRPVAMRAFDKLPLSQRWSISLIQGIKASKFLLDHKNPTTKKTDFLFYGYITKKSVKKILIQSDIDASQAEGLVVAGDGLNAALDVLSEYLKDQETE